MILTYDCLFFSGLPWHWFVAELSDLVDLIEHALLEDENKVWHLVRPADEVDEGKSKRGSMKAKEQTKAITEIYLTRLLSVKVDLCAYNNGLKLSSWQILKQNIFNI